MAQNISLDKSSQSAFAKAIKNIKTLIKKDEEIKDEDSNESNVPTAKKVMGKVETKKPSTKYFGRGVVYLSHIPKGFYEDEMSSYFNQFGRVTRINVVRSRVTGKPKGYAFIEFLYSEVAKVVAETMNNYLMYGKILKAEYIPGDQVRRGMFAFSKICPNNCPRSKTRSRWIEKTNKYLTYEEVTQMASQELKHLDKIKKQMKNIGIDFDCQVEGSTVSLNNPETMAVLELDSMNTLVEHKPSPELLKQKNRKRTLSASSTPSTPEKKRMTLLQGLKSKKNSHSQSPATVLPTLDKTPVLKLKRLDQLTSRSAQKLKKSPFRSPNKENSSPKQTPKKVFTPKVSSSSKKMPSSKLLMQTPAANVKRRMSGANAGKLLPGSGKKAKISGSAKKAMTPDTGKKAITPDTGKKAMTPDTGKKAMTPDSTNKALTPDRKTAVTPDDRKKTMIPDSVKKAMTPNNGKKAMTPDSTNKALTPDRKKAMTPNSRKKIMTPERTKKTKTPHSANKVETPESAKKANTPDSAKKGKKFPLLVGKRMAFSTTKKSLATPGSTKKGKKFSLLVGKRMAFSTSKKTRASRLTKKIKPLKIKAL